MCKQKIKVHFFFFYRSFGIVLWEILTCAVPYHNIDPNAVMWGKKDLSKKSFCF